MSVAETSTAVEATPSRDPRQQLMISSVLGALYFLGSLWLVLVGLPTLWRILNISGLSNEFLADSLLFLVEIPLVIGLFVLGKKLEGPHPTHGMRAGAFYLSFAIVVSWLIMSCGMNLWAFIGILLLVGAIVLFFQPSFLAWLVRVEDQGWFHAVAFKPNQGLRVRRGTVIGVVVLVLCGIYTMITHAVLRTGSHWTIEVPGSNVIMEAVDPWVVYVPFSNTPLLFLYRITLTVPFLILVAAGWFTWRLVNWPTFADFLIATEAEMNKVSWTTRKRLYTDTIVVLVTVVLMTVFLFLVDILWIKILTNPIVDVLKHDPQAAARKNQSGAQW
jgi:preprotein translocase SecE subunit